MRGALHEERVRLFADPANRLEEVFDEHDLVRREALELQVVEQGVLVTGARRSKCDEGRAPHCQRPSRALEIVEEEPAAADGGGGGGGGGRGGGGSSGGRTHQFVLHPAGGADQQLEEVGREVGGQLDLGAAGEVARPHRVDAVRLHHRDLVRALEERDLPADRKALAERPRDLVVELVEAAAEWVEAVHPDHPSEEPPTSTRRRRPLRADPPTPRAGPLAPGRTHPHRHRRGTPPAVRPRTPRSTPRACRARSRPPGSRRPVAAKPPAGGRCARRSPAEGSRNRGGRPRPCQSRATGQARRSSARERRSRRPLRRGSARHPGRPGTRPPVRVRCAGAPSATGRSSPARRAASAGSRPSAGARIAEVPFG